MKKGSTNELTMSTHFTEDRSPEHWISQAEAARIRRVSRQAIARLIKKGRFRVLRIGGKTLLNRAEVEEYAPERPGRPRK